MPPLPIAAVFAELPDPRRETENKLHLRADLLTIAACAVSCGANLAMLRRVAASRFKRARPTRHFD